VCVHIFMFYTPKWVIPSISLLSTMVPFLWRFPQVWMFHIHIHIESTSTIFIFMLFIKPPPTISVLPLAWIVLYSFLNSFIHMCIHCLGHFNLLARVSPSPPFSLASRQNLFCPFFQFCWRETQAIIRQSVFASWDKDSYTERFLALLPCTSVIHRSLIFSLGPDHLPILTSVGLRFLY
jgi:hypothetical protein